jgi:primosomal protein N' (replication factor Y)
MENYHNAMTGKCPARRPRAPVLDRPLASVSVVDMREVCAAEGPDVILSRALREGIQVRLDRKEQALVLLNRRGFATAVFCRQCAGTIDCPNCSVSLVVHGEGNARRARCHYCNFTSRVPPACPLCAGPYLEQAGFGTERVEAEVRKACPGARVARLDRDAIRKRGSLASLLSRFREGADRRPRRHADDRQGPRLPARHPGGRRLRRRRPRPRRLPRLRADLSAS